MNDTPAVIAAAIKPAIAAAIKPVNHSFGCQMVGSVSRSLKCLVNHALIAAKREHITTDRHINFRMRYGLCVTLIKSTCTGSY